MFSKTHPLQDTIIPSIEKTTTASRSSSRNWMLAVVLIIVPVLLLALYTRAVFPGLTHTDALDFAQLGRNIAAGRGLVTYVLRPLALTHGSNALRQPDSTHGPLFPFILALAFGAAGARDAVASAVSGLFYLLTVPLLYALGLRVFNRTVGLVAASAFAFSSLMLEYAVSGLHITLYTFLITALFLVLYNLAANRKAKGDPSDTPLSTRLLLLAGTLTGLLYLTDAIFVWIIPVILGGVIWIGGPHQRAAIFKFLLPLGALMLPWMVRNGIVTGNPVFGLRGAEFWMYTEHYFPGRTAYGMYTDEFSGGAHLLPGVLKKLLFGLYTVVQVLPQISSAWILAFLLPSLLFGYTSAAAMMLRRLMLFSFAALLFGMLFFHVEMTLFSGIVPVMLVFAVAYLTHLVKQATLPRFSQWTVGVLLGVAIAYPLLGQILLDKKAQALPESNSAKALGKISQAGHVILSDRPDIVAWYADRPSVQVPTAEDRVADVRKQFPETRWVLLTPGIRDVSDQWQSLYDQCVRWNTVYMNAQGTNSRVPLALRISGSVQPLFKALEGFTSVSPALGSAPAIVLAELPAAKTSSDSKTGRGSAP